MNKKNKILIRQADFPNQLAPDAEKDSLEYGLKVGKAIQYEWFKKKGNSCRFYDQWTDFHRLRLYARGEQSVQKYKKEMSVEGDLSMLNLDWTPVPIIPKFVDIVVNGISNRDFSVKAYSQDAMSAEKRSEYQDLLEADMIAKDMLIQTKEMFGVDAFNVDPDTIPNSDQELSLHMQLNYKPAIEIAEEEAVSTVFDMNRFTEIKKRVDRDITTLGIGVAKHRFSYDGGIILEYVNPAEIVYSYTEDPDFKDVFYWGEIKQIHITELKKIKPDITPEELEDIHKSSGLWSTEYSIMRPYNDDVMQKEIVNVLFFNYKTDYNFVWKKKILDNGGERAIRRDESFNPPADEDAMFERVDKTIDVWREGVVVLGTDHILQWNISKNMVRPESAFQKVHPNYIAAAPRMYKGNIESLVRRMIPFADLIQVIHLKIQQVASKVVPDGIFIDVDGMNDIDLGNGTSYNPHEAIKMFLQTGTVIGRSRTEDGEFNHAKIPIQEITHSSGHNKIRGLIETYNFYLNAIRDVTGLNEARDGSMPDPDALVGIQKMAAYNSNVATKHILDAGMDITLRMAECVSLRIADVLQYADFREEFAMQIGKYNVALLDEISTLYLHSFGIFMEVSPDEEEELELETNIQIALKAQGIDLEDAIDIREIKNLKLANQLLKLKRKEKEERDAAREEKKMQMQGEINAQSAAAAAQAKMEAVNAEAQAKIEIETVKSNLLKEQDSHEAQLKLSLMREEFNFSMQLAKVNAGATRDNDAFKEDRKDERTKIQASQASEHIDQRNTGKPPKKFESNEDSLDGFGTNSFV